MHIVTIHSQKGGSGRSTLAVNLAVEAEKAGRRVLVCDLDPQCSSASWLDRREAATPAVTAVTPARLSKALQTAKSGGIDLVIIDTAPHSADAAIMASEASDVILVPCQPWAPDLETLSNTARIASLCEKPAYVLIAMAPQAPRQIAEAIEVAKEHGFEVAPMVLYRRAAIAHAQTIGLAVGEYDPASKAADEIRAIWKWLQTHIGTNAQRHNGTGVRKAARAVA